MRAAHLEGYVCAVEERARQGPTNAQTPRRHEELDTPVSPVREKFGNLVRAPCIACLALSERSIERLQQLGRRVVVRLTTVVRIDQAEVPELVPLVGVRHARPAELEHQLADRIHRAGTR